MSHDEFQKAMIALLGRPTIIEHVGDNSVHEFVAERKWACVVEYPSQHSNRADASLDMLAQTLSDSARMKVDLYLDVHFAFQNGQAGVWSANDEEPLGGESVKIKLYRNGQLIAETDDQIIWSPLQIRDGEIFNEDGKLLLNKHGKYFPRLLSDDDFAERPPTSSALENWLVENKILLEVTPEDRAHWQTSHSARLKDMPDDFGLE